MGMMSGSMMSFMMAGAVLFLLLVLVALVLGNVALLKYIRRTR
nr:hypothetical protein RNT25_04366 [arsenite-oxidising bacterium NT-25]